jgi:hypothetical protein
VTLFSDQLKKARREVRFPDFPLKATVDKLHEHFVITPADKNPQKIVFWCRHLYRKVLTEHMDPSVIKPQTDHAPDWYLERASQNIEFYEREAPRAFPYYYVIPKLHRLDTHRSPWRGITGKSGKNVIGDNEPLEKPEAFSSRLGPDVASGLNSCIDIIINSELGAKIRRCWICRDSQELIDVFGNIPQEIGGLRTIDFKTMYTQLQHRDLKNGLRKALIDVRDILAKKFGVTSEVAWTRIIVSSSKDGPSWTLLDEPARRECMSIKHLFEASKTIIDNCYTFTGGQVFLQVIGLPMGAEPSPPLANLYFYSLEKEFVDKKVAELGEDEVIKRYLGFRFNLRYIDDLIMPDLDDQIAPCMSEADYGGCKYSITGRGTKVVFLGIQVTKEKNRAPIFRAQDKQQFFDFTVVRYPTWYSTIPRHVRVGTLVGMLVRTMRLTTNNDDFFAEVKYLYQLFRARQYKLDEMKQGIQKFLHGHVKTRYHADFRRVSDPWLAEWENPQPIRLPEAPKPPKPAAVSTATQAEEGTSDLPSNPTLDQVVSAGGVPPPPPPRPPPPPLVVRATPPPPTPAPLSKKRVTFSFATGQKIEKPRCAELKDADSRAENEVGNQLAILDSNGAIQEPSSNRRGYGSSTTAGPGGFPDLPQVVEHIHHHHHVHEAPAAPKPVVNHIYNDNRTQVSGDQYNNHGTVNNVQMNGGQNFGTVNQQQNNNCDVLTGDLQQQLHLHQHQQVEYHQHNQLVAPPASHQHDVLKLQPQNSANPQQQLLIEDRGSGEAGSQLLLLGAPPSAPADQQQPAPVQQTHDPGKAGSPGSPVVVESGINSTPSRLAHNPRRATSLDRSTSQSRPRASQRSKRKRGKHGLVDSHSASGTDVEPTTDPSYSDNDNSSCWKGEPPPDE